ncbi:MAG: PHB depolymerase family esterase [Bacteroidota bacterium]
MKVKNTISIAICFFVIAQTCSWAQGTITPVSGFGTNPGSLNMYTYIPNGLTGPAPLVIAMHGCTQSASIYAAQTGWNKLADLHKFYVVYPEQITANNGSKCFNWFDPNDVNKNQGEALSVKQMVDYMIANHSIDPSAIFATGLSAGAAMTVVMLADYPEIFNKGAVMAGVPYKAATSSLNAYTAMNGGVTKTPTQWGDLVRNQNLSYSGSQPHMAIFHGTQDFTVNIANATELIKQWTNVNGADQTVDSTFTSFQGNSAVEKTVYTDNSNTPVVEYYKITAMGHAISLDTGACPRQGGATGTYASEKNFHSTYWAAKFFNILTSPYTVNGLIQVPVSATNIVYSVTSTPGSTYAWAVPAGATIASGQGTSSITVNFGSTSGYVNVTETASGNCINEGAELYIDVSITSNINSFKRDNNFIYINENGTILSSLDLNELKAVTIYNTIGQVVRHSYSVQENRINLSSGLKTGVYIVHISIAQKLYTLKMTVY